MAQYDLPIINGVLMAALAACSIRALRVLMRMDGRVPAPGARRVQFRLALDDPMPMDALSESLNHLVVARSVVFLFVDSDCGCGFVNRAAPNLAASYRDIQFVLCSSGPVEEKNLLLRRGVHVEENSSLPHALGIYLWPYVMKTSQGKVVEFGIVNTADHIESVILA